MSFFLKFYYIFRFVHISFIVLFIVHDMCVLSLGVIKDNTKTDRQIDRQI